MTTIKFDNVEDLIPAMESELTKIQSNLLGVLGDHIFFNVESDYKTRVQKEFPAIIHPVTREVVSKMQPKQIAENLEKLVETSRVVVYIPKDTLADQEARRQELFGGKPWERMRGKMMNLDYVQNALNEEGVKGIRVKPVV